jgi:outer membrane protein
MKKFTLYTMVAATMLAFTPAVMAADAPAPATAANLIATVNIQQILDDSSAHKSASEQMESKEKTFQAELSKKQEQLQKEQQDLGKQSSVLSKPAFEEKVRAFRAKETDAQKEMQSKRAILDKGFQGALSDIYKAVTEIITDLSKEKGFSMAIPTQSILYADPKLDISDEVLKRLNQKLPKVDVKFDAAAAPAKADKSDKK